ncbi:MAG: hypothetical protein ABSD78_11655 [Acidimicrobiales bacterium]|jgi:hypothetical protein
MHDATGSGPEDHPSVQRVELPVGDATLELTAEEVGEIVGYLLTDQIEGS